LLDCVDAPPHASHFPISASAAADLLTPGNDVGSERLVTVSIPKITCGIHLGSFSNSLNKGTLAP
jgi:hypothetical protein